MYVTPILFRGSAFAFAGMNRCRLSPLSTAALRGVCPFPVGPTRCQLPAASCLLYLGCRLSRPVGGRGPAFFTLSREEFNNLKSQIMTSRRVSFRTVCDIRENLKGLGYGV